VASPHSDLAPRLGTALVGLPLLVGVVWVGGLPLMALVAGAGVLGTAEFLGLARRAGARPLTPLALAWAVPLALAPTLPPGTLAPTLSAGVLGAGVGLSLRREPRTALADLGTTLAGPLLVAWPLGYALALRALPGGPAPLLLALGAVFASDTGAYFLGRALGRRPLAPSISPSKTVEGAVGGLLCGALAGLALAFLPPAPLTPWQGALAGAIASLAGQVGDLAESALKRSAGVKDSGRLLPGHGGLLDRLDSLLFGLVAVYYTLRAVGVPAFPPLTGGV